MVPTPARRFVISAETLQNSLSETVTTIPETFELSDSLQEKFNIVMHNVVSQSKLSSCVDALKQGDLDTFEKTIVQAMAMLKVFEDKPLTANPNFAAMEPRQVSLLMRTVRNRVYHLRALLTHMYSYADNWR